MNNRVNIRVWAISYMFTTLTVYTVICAITDDSVYVNRVLPLT